MPLVKFQQLGKDGNSDERQVNAVSSQAAEAMMAQDERSVTRY